MTDDTQITDQDVEFQLDVVLRLMSEAKPEDRSDKDRRYAVARTELEKVVAYFKHYIINGGK